jgi:hypothetical protein
MNPPPPGFTFMYFPQAKSPILGALEKRNSIIRKKKPCKAVDRSGGWSPVSHRGGPGSSPGHVMWDLWWKKWQWDRFSPSTSVSPANSPLHQQLHIHHHLSSGSGTLGQTVADVASGPSLTPPKEKTLQYKSRWRSDLGRPRKR